MLKRLRISNLAIIENVDIAFEQGFTVLTGATGAGKSLIIDSLSLLLGERASSELIRTGEDKATIVGDFLVSHPRLEGLLSKMEIPLIDGNLTIERTISKSKSSIKANGVSLSLSDLTKISKYLADIHSQLDFVKILNPENYLEMLDGFAYEKASKYKEEYVSLFLDYKTKKQEYAEILAKRADLERNKDILSFQLKELEAARLSEGEEEEIEKEISLLKNYDQIYSLSQEAESIIREDFLDRLYDLSKTLGKLSSYQSQYKEAKEKTEDRYYELDDLFATLKKGFASLDYDPNRLNELEQRQYDLNGLKRKYGKTIAELIAYRDELSSFVGDSSNFEIQVDGKKKEMELALEKAISKGKELSLIRHSVAKTIEKEIQKNLSDLSLRANFKISFISEDSIGEESLKENGIDEVEFLIETNIGEGLKSLSKVVSGGEASRIMLAFKTIFVKANKVETVIFDEIDVGISGEEASKVAKKIAEISYGTQVMAITHLPQVAAKSDHHILICKSTKDGRTFVKIKELTLEEKIEEIASLISGGKISQKQLDYAREIVLEER